MVHGMNAVTLSVGLRFGGVQVESLLVMEKTNTRFIQFSDTPIAV